MNVKVTSRTETSMTMYILGMNLQTQEIGLYGYLFSLRSPIVDLEVGDFLTSETIKQNIFAIDGRYVGDVSLESVTKNNKISFEIYENFNDLKNTSYNSERNLITSMMNGKPFNNILPIGTVGNIFLNNKKQYNQDFKNLLNFEISKLNTTGYDDYGNPITVENVFYQSEQNKKIPYILEFLTDEIDDTLVRFLPCVFTDFIKYSEEDINKIKFELSKYSDCFHRTDNFISKSEYELNIDYIYENPTIPIPDIGDLVIDNGDGYTTTITSVDFSNIDNLEFSDNIGEVKVDCVVISNDLPINTNIGDEIALVNDDGTTYILKVYDTNKFSLVALNTFGNYFRVFSKYYTYSNDITEKVSNHCFLSLETNKTEVDGLSLTAKCIKHGDDFIIKTYMYNKQKLDFEEYFED